MLQGVDRKNLTGAPARAIVVRSAPGLHPRRTSQGVPPGPSGNHRNVMDGSAISRFKHSPAGISAREFMVVGPRPRVHRSPPSTHFKRTAPKIVERKGTPGFVRSLTEPDRRSNGFQVGRGRR